MMRMYTIAALYHFTRFDDPAALQAPLRDACEVGDVRGSLLIAAEGINGTIAGPRAGIDAVLAHIRALPGCADLEWKESTAMDAPFARMKVRLKREIVTMGVRGVDPKEVVGAYVEPEDWNALIDRDDVLLVDTRNTYEYEVGTFHAEGGRAAVDPRTGSFREFPRFADAALDPVRHKKVAMFCTGGIRCEKATAYLKQRGFDEVFHLRGGILKYLEAIPEAESRWRGECFVFDDRVAVGNGLKPGSFDLCYGCRMPVHASAQSDPRYQVGVSCPRCHAELSPERAARLAERHRQVEIALASGDRHIGDITRATR